MTMKVQSLTDLQDRRIMLDRDVPPYGYAFVILVGIFMVFLLVWSTQTNRIYVSQNTGTVQASNRPTSCPAIPVPLPKCISRKAAM